MFGHDFYPTPPHVIDIMMDGEIIKGKIFFEPEAGKGDIVDYLLSNGAESVIACEIHPELRKILSTKCKVIADDFLTVQSHQVSHIDHIVMNPPFSGDEKHILHAFDIAPPGCKITALCNVATLEKARTAERKRLLKIINESGSSDNIGQCFSSAQRTTNVDIALIKLQKPGSNYDQEFEGFFMEEEPEEQQENGIMSYNVVRDIVNRYVSAVKLFDQQLEVGIQMESLIGDITPSYTEEKEGQGLLAFTATRNGIPLMRTDFKKGLQKRSWLYIFEKMNLQKYSTKGLKEDINKFVEKQKDIPFSMRNIYKMLEIVVGTAGSRMDKSLIEVFDKLTMHYDDNRYSVAGWKTNSHFLVNKKFIMPYICNHSTGMSISMSWSESCTRNREIVEDFVKALCYLTGDDYYNFQSLAQRVSEPILVRNKHTKELIKNKYNHQPEAYKSISEFEKGKWRMKYDGLIDDESVVEEVVQQEALYGEWFDWAYFRVKAFKKGTMHFEFKDQELWAKFNQHIARIKGYPLFEGKEQTAYQNRQTGRTKKQAA